MNYSMSKREQCPEINKKREFLSLKKEEEEHTAGNFKAMRLKPIIITRVNPRCIRPSEMSFWLVVPGFSMELNFKTKKSNESISNIRFILTDIPIKPGIRNPNGKIP